MGDGPKRFSADEAGKIRDAIWAAADHLECPGCGAQLIMSPPPDGESSTAFWELRCDSCGRAGILQDLL